MSRSLGKRRFAFRIGRSRQRKRRWSLEEVTQISVRTFSGFFDAFAEPSDHSRGKWPEPFIEDGHGSCRVHNQVWPAVVECCVCQDFPMWTSGGQSERLLTGPPRLVIRMSGESSFRSGATRRRTFEQGEVVRPIQDVSRGERERRTLTTPVEWTCSETNKKNYKHGNTVENNKTLAESKAHDNNRLEDCALGHHHREVNRSQTWPTKATWARTNARVLMSDP